MDPAAEFRPHGGEDRPTSGHGGGHTAPQRRDTVRPTRRPSAYDETAPMDPIHDAPTHRTHPSHRRSAHGSTHARIDGYADGTEREGDEIGNYKLLTELGSGGFGTSGRDQPFAATAAMPR